MQPLNVFLSHINPESKLAEILETAITRDFIGLVNFFVSSDIFSIPVGEQWGRKLIDGLAKSELHIVLCSPESVERPWINFETGAACLRGVPIAPICHSGLSPTQLPLPLSKFQAILASDRHGLTKLYTSIAAMLGATVPDSKLDELARQVMEFEAEYKKHIAVAAQCEITPPSDATIRSPRVLCATSQQFVSLRSEDFEIIQKAFPDTTTHRREVTAQAVKDALMHEHFDIVHVATYVCPKTGDLVFSDVDFDTAQQAAPTDFIPAKAFASLTSRARTKLAVIASCESFELGAELLSVSDVIATRDIISFPMFAEWIKNFYEGLQTMTLSEAFDYSISASRAPMRLYTRQSRVAQSSSSETAVAV